MWIRFLSATCRPQKIFAAPFTACLRANCRRAGSTGYGSRRRRTISLSMRGRRRVAKSRSEEAHAGATIQTIRTVAVNRSGADGGVAAKGLEQCSTQQIYAELLARFDGDPTRDGLLKTPERMEKAMKFLTRGYGEDPLAILRTALFDVD